MPATLVPLGIQDSRLGNDIPSTTLTISQNPWIINREAKRVTKMERSRTTTEWSGDSWKGLKQWPLQSLLPPQVSGLTGETIKTFFLTTVNKTAVQLQVLEEFLLT